MASEPGAHRGQHNDTDNSPPCLPDITHLPVHSVTVGDRGQVVLPAELRRQCKHQTHDKLLIFRYPDGTSTLALLQFTYIEDYLQCFNELHTDNQEG